jgi:hypothetical protein
MLILLHLLLLCVRLAVEICEEAEEDCGVAEEEDAERFGQFAVECEQAHHVGEHQAELDLFINKMVK